MKGREGLKRVMEVMKGGESDEVRGVRCQMKDGEGGRRVRSNEGKEKRKRREWLVN